MSSSLSRTKDSSWAKRSLKRLDKKRVGGRSGGAGGKGSGKVKLPRSSSSYLNMNPNPKTNLRVPSYSKTATGPMEKFLESMDDPDYWRTFQASNLDGTPLESKLTTKDIHLLTQIHKGDYGKDDGEVDYDPYEPSKDFFTQDVFIHPLSARPEPKSRFTPSKWEALAITKMVRAIKKGWMKVNDGKETDKPKMTLYDAWSSAAGSTQQNQDLFHSRHIAAPRMALPTTEESYNAPSEYLLDSEDERTNVKQGGSDDDDDEKPAFTPKKFKSMREITNDFDLLSERYSRCLDLFLCPRAIKDRIMMHPDDLLPSLPDPATLKPFPTTLSILFEAKNTEDPIAALSVDPSGRWLLSSSQEGVIKLWEIQTGHCRQTWTSFKKAPTAPLSICWNPNKNLFMFAVGSSNMLSLVVPSGLPNSERTLELLEDGGEHREATSDWKFFSTGSNESGLWCEIAHLDAVVDVTFHRRGDYLVTLAPPASSSNNHASGTINVHQISKAISQKPLNKMPGLVKKVAFHPMKPQLILCTTRSVRIYDLQKKEQLRRLIPSGSQSLSSLSCHPSGDHIVCGALDGRVMWFDLDWSVRPWKVLSAPEERGAIRGVTIHQKEPLFASCGDSGIKIFHGKVETGADSLATQPIIVPVREIVGPVEGASGDNGVGGDYKRRRQNLPSITAIEWHPSQPWIFAADDEGRIGMWV